MTLRNAIVELNRALDIRHAPLLVDFDDYDCIVAAHYSFDPITEMCVLLRHPEGHIDLTVGPKVVQGIELEEWDDSVGCALAGGTAGLAILASLPGDVPDKIGLKAVNMGGPRATVPMAMFTGDSRDLQDALIEYDLPFRLIMGRILDSTHDRSAPSSKQLKEIMNAAFAPDNEEV
jgi:hypothetical protein